MQIRYGYAIEITCEQDLPLITLLDVHPSRRHDLVRPDEMVATALADPSRRIRVGHYLDQFGNICRRLVAPAGGVAIDWRGIAPVVGTIPRSGTARGGAVDGIPALGAPAAAEPMLETDVCRAASSGRESRPRRNPRRTERRTRGSLLGFTSSPFPTPVMP